MPNITTNHVITNTNKSSTARISRKPLLESSTAVFAARCYLPQSIRGLPSRHKKRTGRGKGEKCESRRKERELDYEGILLRVDYEQYPISPIPLPSSSSLSPTSFDVQ